MATILVMGSTGMLGSSIKSELLNSKLEVFFTSRREISQLSKQEYFFDSLKDHKESWFENKPKFDYVINCIGAIPQKYKAHSGVMFREMVELNSLLPQFLDYQSSIHGFQTIQIATDCVFSGNSGGYSEESLHDASDIYGITKSLGEKYTSSAMLLRCSIIGRNDESNSSLHNWLLAHKENSSVSGYKNHYWNGITTNAFARIIRGVIESGLFSPGVQHIVPSDEVTKFQLLKIIADLNRREDLKIVPVAHNMTINRTLTSINPHKNQLLWSNIGYKNVPSITDLVREMDA
jgi:dTDP-4-dehydrorhamnose reductase